MVDRLDHVQRLGVSHVYLSPIAEAVPGSTHGYDVVDHTRVREELGGPKGFERVLDAVAGRGMAVIVDHVPNHVATTRPELNPPWWALLRDGPESDAARWFDVDWEATAGKVVLPVLGMPIDEALGAGAIEVVDDVLIVHGERRLPIAAGTRGLALTELLAAQHYRLQHWRKPARNVRRFFTIDDLVAVRVEIDDVAVVVDSLPARYADTPGFGGVRVDHVDGLADPAGYLHGLRTRIGADALLYVEKILAPGESLPPMWPVEGTTGYEFIRSVDHLVLAADAAEALTQVWVELAGDDRPFHAFEEEARREVASAALAPDVARLRRQAGHALASDLDAEAVEGIDREVFELATRLPRYRTYLPDDPDAVALVGAISSGPVADAILRPRDVEQERVRTRWQQLTGRVMAKGAEDCSFYRYLRLASLCEVGGDPGAFGLSAPEFHAENLDRQGAWPLAMLAGSTHDTKRSEDVRARSAALTWRTVDRRVPLADGGHRSSESWPDVAQAWVRELAGRTGLDAVTVWLAVQTVACTPGLTAERLTDYLVKASREAAVHTRWEEPDDDFEHRLPELAELVIGSGHLPSLGLDAVAPGLSLVSTVLHLMCPGVPDIYQGAEAFTFRLVDPDNRVTPDWNQLDRYAREDRSVAELWSHDDPAIKTVLLRELLRLRRRHAAAFGAAGTYQPIDADPGTVAFGRGDDVVVVVRLGLAEVMGSLEFPVGRWYDVLDPEAPTLSGTVELAAVVGSGADLTLPIAVFEHD